MVEAAGGRWWLGSPIDTDTVGVKPGRSGSRDKSPAVVEGHIESR